MRNHRYDDADALVPATPSGGILDALTALRAAACVCAMTLALQLWCAQPSRWFRRAAR